MTTVLIGNEMTPEELTHYLHREVPLTAAMQIRVTRQTPRDLEMSAPLAPNLNLHGTAFAGSLATLGLISGWTLIYGALQDAAITAELFAQKSECVYHAPATTTLRASATLDETDWTTFVQTFRDKGRARLTVVSKIYAGDTLAVTHTGTYAARA